MKFYLFESLILDGLTFYIGRIVLTIISPILVEVCLYCPNRTLLARPGRVAQSVGHLTRKSGVLGAIPGLATYFPFSFCFLKKGSCQLLAKICARSTG